MGYFAVSFALGITARGIGMNALQAGKTTTDLKGQKIRTNQNTLKAFLSRTD